MYEIYAAEVLNVSITRNWKQAVRVRIRIGVSARCGHDTRVSVRVRVRIRWGHDATTLI